MMETESFARGSGDQIVHCMASEVCSTTLVVEVKNKLVDLDKNRRLDYHYVLSE